MNEWISVDDELPEDEDSYLIAWIPDGYNGYGGDPNTCFIEICEFNPNEKEFCTEKISRNWRLGITIYAWMPLPKLYVLKGRRRNEV